VSEAFASGQAYVALSRCRTLSGMVLRNLISTHNIIGDPAILRFNEQARVVKPSQATLERDRVSYERYLLGELFSFSPLQSKIKGFGMLLPHLEKDILSVAEKFTLQLKPERSGPAAVYFLDKLQASVDNLHLQLPGLIGTSKELAKKADQLIIWLMNRVRLMEHFAEVPFTTAAYLAQTKDKIKTYPGSYLKALNALPNEKLYEQLLDWREKTAAKENVMPNMVLSEKTAAAIAEKLPPTLKALGAIKGVGAHKATQYGAELIGLIRTYQQELQGPVPEQVSLF
jgi:hypothetical protein